MYVNNDIDYLKYLKNKNLILFGAGIVGKHLFARLNKQYRLVAFCDNDENKQNQLFCGIPVLSFKKICEINDVDSMIIICSNHEREIRQQLLDANIFNVISMCQIDFGGGEEYYDEQYFSYQQEMGKFGGRIKAKMFQRYINDRMSLVEFGAGGGYLLENLIAREKIGIEINDTARKEAEARGIHCVKYISDIPNDYADIIISTSVLEHVENPFGALQELRNKLKDDGKVVFHVPNESCDTEYRKSEKNNHLYTWNCLTLGNLFKAAGFFVQSVQKVQEVWPKYYSDIEKAVSPQLFEVLCEIGGKAYDENRCIIVAHK